MHAISPPNRDSGLMDKALIFIAATVAWSHDAVGLTITNFLAIPIMNEFGVGKDALGFLFSAQFIATVFGAIIFGELADRVGRKKALVYSVLWDSILTGLSAVAPSYEILALLRILSGMGVSWGIAFALLSETYSPSHRGLFGGLIHATFVLGYVLSAATVSIVYPIYGWRICYLIGLFAIPIILILAYLMPESRIWMKYKELEEAGEIEVSEIRFRELVADKMLLQITIIASIVFWGSEFSYHVIVDWGPTLLSEYFGFTVDEASTIILIIALFVVFFLPLVGFLSDYFGRRSMFMAASSIGLVGTIMLGYFTFLEINKPLALITFYIIPIGFSSQALYGVWLSELFPTRVRATATSFIFSVARGLSLGAFVVGLASKYIGFIDSIIYFGLFGFIIMVTLPILLPETKGKIIKPN